MCAFTVTGSLVALEGAATICDRCEFARNSGEYSVHMSRNDKRQLQTIQFSITKAVMSQTPPLRFYNATGSISVVWDGRQHGATSREPVITLEQPASVHMFESLFTNFVSSGPVDLPIVSITLGGTPQTDLTNFFSRIIMSNFTRYCLYQPTIHPHVLNNELFVFLLQKLWPYPALDQRQWQHPVILDGQHQFDHL